jgi:uncharacterized NAD(P)/FAD-binding protein YdhS
VRRLRKTPPFDTRINKFITGCVAQNGVEGEIETDYVINSVGQCLDITKVHDNELLTRAIAEELFIAHPSGGIDVDYRTGAVRGKDGTPSKQIFVVGSLTRGVHFYTNSISQNAISAHRAVMAIMQDLCVRFFSRSA